MDKCKNKTCKKVILNFYICKSCKANLCSTTCLNLHKSDCQQMNLSQKPTFSISTQPIQYQRSIFMKQGKIINVNSNDDPYFSKSNFEFVRKNQKKVVIGEGAFAEVYLIKHKQDGNFYALKQMDKEKLSSGGMNSDMIYREIMIQRRLNHDNIIRLFSSEEDDKNYYLILEYAIGGTLFGKIKKMKTGFDEDTSFKYFIQASAAIAFLHENKLVHRDIKPENFLIDSNGIIRLCDFGWCRDLNDGQRNTFCGTYEYMAPELVKDQPYSYGIDTWALGVLLYELIHGYSPFRSIKNKNNEDEIIQNIVKYKFKIEKDISKELEDLIYKLLTPDHKERLTVFQIFTHPWVKLYEKKYNEMKDKKKEEDKNNFSLLKEIRDSDINNSNTNVNQSIISNVNIEKDIIRKMSNKNIDFNKQQINKDKEKPEKQVKDSLLNDFSIFSNDNEKEKVDKPNKIVISSKAKANNQASNKNLSQLMNDNDNEITPLPFNSEVLYKKQSGDTSNINFIKTIDEDETMKKTIRYVDYYEQSFFDGVDALELNYKQDLQNLNISNMNNIDEMSIINTPDEDPNQSLFDDVLNNVFLKNNGKKKKATSNLNSGLGHSHTLQNNVGNKKKSIPSDGDDLQKEKDKRSSNVNDNVKSSNGNFNSNSRVYMSNSNNNYSTYTNSNMINKVNNSNRNSNNNSTIQNDIKVNQPQLKKESNSINKNIQSSNKQDQPEKVKIPINQNKDKQNQGLDERLKEKLRYEFENETKEIINIANNNNYFHDDDIKEYKAEMRRTNIKDVNKELDLGFLPKELLYNDLSYEKSKNEILHAIDILEGAAHGNESKSIIFNPNLNRKTEKGFFSNLFSAFKCGSD